jgi:recombination protein RecT
VNGNGNGQIQQRGQAAQPTLKSFLESPAVKAKLAEVANKVMKPEDLIRMALMAISRNPDIAKCTQASIVRSLIDAAELGIQPGGTMGRGYLVPRKNTKVQPAVTECCFDPGWRGLIDVARRSGLIARIEAHVVYQKDVFRVAYGVESKIVHEPMLDGEAGPIVAAYAVAFFKDGTYQAEVLRKADIDKIRGSSASANGPWAKWYDEMARKSAVRRLCKYLPFDSLLEKALESATEADAEDPMVQDVDVVLEQRPAKGAALADKIRSRATNGVPNDIEVRELEEMLAEPAGEVLEDERSPIPPAVGSRPGGREPGED